MRGGAPAPLPPLLRAFLVAGLAALALAAVSIGARVVVPEAVNVHAPSRCGIPRSQSSSDPPRCLKAGTRRHSSGWTGPQW